VRPDILTVVSFLCTRVTRATIILDQSVLYVASRKQKCVTKSPMEAELVGLTDNLGLIVLFHEFVSFLVGKEVALPIAYPDSTSVVALVTKGGGVVRTKHLRVRMHLAKEQLEKKRLVIQHVKAEGMVAYGASKPLKGEDYQQFCRVVQGISSTTG
jgi:hypothetical protein